MDSAYSTKVSQLFTKGSHHHNISLVLITQNVFNQDPSSRDISINSKYIVVFTNPRDKTKIVHLARQVYPKNISSFHKMYLEVCKDPHKYLFLDLTNQLKIFSDLEQIFFTGTLLKCLRLFGVMNRLKSQLHFLQVIKDAKTRARRALLASADDDSIKAIVECAINTLNGNHKFKE